MANSRLIGLSVRGLLLSALLACAVVTAQAQNSNLPGPSAGAAVQQQAAPATAAAAGPATIDDSYRLGAGDKLKVTVYGEDDLGGEFIIDGTGQVQLPLVGQVQAAGLSVRTFSDQVQQTLAGKYLRDPRVNVQIMNYRPFYIMGEVNKPGEYPYRNGLNVLGAVALAGGFTYRASEGNVYIRRIGSSEEEKVPVSMATTVNPGDIVRVPERLF